MPFVDDPGKAGGTLFWHNGPIVAKVGAFNKPTVISIVAVDAHCPEPGVKVYVVVPVEAVLIVEGLQVPGTPLVEVAGKAGGVLFWQSGPMGVKAGDSCGSTVIFKEPGTAH